MENNSYGYQHADFDYFKKCKSYSIYLLSLPWHHLYCGGYLQKMMHFHPYLHSTLQLAKSHSHFAHYKNFQPLKIAQSLRQRPTFILDLKTVLLGWNEWKPWALPSPWPWWMYLRTLNGMFEDSQSSLKTISLMKHPSCYMSTCQYDQSTQITATECVKTHQNYLFNTENMPDLFWVLCMFFFFIQYSP